MGGKSGHGRSRRKYLAMFDAQAAAFLHQHELDPTDVTDEDLAVTAMDGKRIFPSRWLLTRNLMRSGRP